MDTDGNVLEVLLGDVPVGHLTLLSHGTDAVDRAEFAFVDSYRELAPRPVLGQFFEDDLARRHVSRMRLPPFFSNLLPEGPLRELIAKREGVSPEREFFLLARLGEDLPGAVRVRPVGAIERPDDAGRSPEVVSGEGSPLKFSLAGVQLKFSMVRQGRGLTLPVSGAGGDWILKLPHARFQHVPENEFATMTWAKASGIDVPEVGLVQASEVTGLPPEVAQFQEPAYFVRRFDRPSPGTRVHMEDFAQVRGVYPAEKYEKANYETIAKILVALAGPAALTEFIRRLVFLVLAGNDDAHLKNWSLIYPNGFTAQLSPAYDLVSTIQYPGLDYGLALNLAGSKKYSDVKLDSFARLGRVVGLSEDTARADARAAVEATKTAWSKVRADLPIPDAFKQRIEEHWKTLQL